MSLITEVTVHLDDNVPDYMEGIIRCSSVSIEYEDGSEKADDSMIDNAEYLSEVELVKDIAKRLEIPTGIVNIEY
ncbi:hypothetical protein ACT3TY_16815 [Halomonas sp. AOP22-C1-8]|uniref:hypothetical protein n=1 Tax=Halomonas sp. AOP22-C1-8 TaxID=3457717 RepID=UPI0040348781